MTDVTSEAVRQRTDLDTLGPVDYLVVEFPAGKSNFTGEMATELVKLVDSGTIRVIDILILTKNEDGSVDAMELSEVEELGPLQALEAELAAYTPTLQGDSTLGDLAERPRAVVLNKIDVPEARELADFVREEVIRRFGWPVHAR